MDVRKKLVELLREAPYNIFGNKLGNCYFDSCLGMIADHLITHGVTVQECKLGAKKTNADRIRNMTNEELVVFLDGFSSQCIECAEHGKNESCPIYKEGHYCKPQEVMEWLKKPAEVNDYETN